MYRRSLPHFNSILLVPTLRMGMPVGRSASAGGAERLNCITTRSVVTSSILTLLFLLTGCVQKISYQPRYGPLEQSTFFADGRASRHLVEGTVARGMAQTDVLLYQGMQDGRQAELFPFQVNETVLLRGQERFNIYCSPCHSASGGGNGMVVQRGYPAPPSLHEDRLRMAPVGYLFNVITNGRGVMPSYNNQIPVEDRWAIIAYVRALQFSQHAPVDELPASVQAQISEAAQ